MAEDIKVPDLGESVSEGTLAKWIKKKGDTVKQDEAIAELETDKVAMEINAPEDGVISETLVEEGDTVEVGDVVARLDTDGKAEDSADDEEKEEAEKEKDVEADEDKDKEDEEEDTAEESEDEKEEEDSPEGGEDESEDEGKEDKEDKKDRKEAPMSPSAKKLAKEHGLAASDIDGTGKDGRITKADVEKAVEAKEGADKEEDTGKSEDKKEEKKEDKPKKEKAEKAERETGEREERVPMSRLRKRIAERLKEAQDTAAMLTTFNEADMSAVMRYRNEYRDAFEDKHGIRLGFMSFFVKAAVRALQDIPAVNAEIDGDDIIYKNHYDIGVAVSTPNGLVVPVVRDADKLSFAELEKTIHDLGRRGRDGKLKLEELQGGTFTISNGGVFGSLMSAPILNPPQSGILGMHKIQERPVALDGEVVIRPMMYLALSYDHRIVDGKEAVTFLVRIKECIEDPGRLMLDL